MWKMKISGFVVDENEMCDLTVYGHFVHNERYVKHLKLPWIKSLLICTQIFLKTDR